MAIHIRTLLAGMPREIDDGKGDPWRSGFIKQPIAGPARLGRDQLVGDGQADRSVHGGAEKALLAYCGEHYPRWNAEFGRDAFADGAFGENLCLTGLDEEGAAIGDTFRVGDALIEVAQPRQPCWKLARRNAMPDLPAKAIVSGRLGWYFRVLEPGAIAAGQALQRVDRPNPAWSIARINRLFFGPASDARPLFDEAARLPGMSPEFLPTCRRRFPSMR